MARSIALIFVFFLVSSTTMSSTVESRKLLVDNNKNGPSSLASLLLSALPKGTVPSSSPSKKGHATLDNQKLFRRHLRAIDRILQSVPSPGAGH